MSENETYSAEQIQILEGLEAVRKRPGMYIGSTSGRGLHHLVYEIVDNAVDEALAGYCSEINVFINEDNSITVVDNGRGIPVDIQKKAGRPAVEVVFTVLHAGGKFGGGGYKVSGGLHGVGSSVVNALSDWLEVEVSRDGKIYKQRYERGNVAYDLKVVGESTSTGTKVTFKPDATIFDEVIPTLTLPKKDLESFAQAVLTRFNNPYVKHALLSISLNSVSKWRARCMPRFLGYVEKKGSLPKHLTFSLAALLAFYTGSEIRDKALIGHRGDQEYQILDDAAVLEFFAANSGKEAGEYAKAVLSNESFWGQDLTQVPGALKAVSDYLRRIRTNGMRKAVEELG